jgi:hypothetical protein
VTRTKVAACELAKQRNAKWHQRGNGGEKRVKAAASAASKAAAGKRHVRRRKAAKQANKQ